MAAGDHDAVVARLGVLAEVLRHTDLPEGIQPWQADLVEALVAVDRLDEASRELAELRRRVSGGGAHVRAGVGRVGGFLAAAQGDDDAAVAIFDRALADDAVATGAFVRGRLELAAGAFHRRAGRRRIAAALLADALDRFDALGAEPFRVRAARELDSCGLMPRRRGDAGGQVLTRSERAITALVADGRTNREVATQLAVSVKTVESHLARIFVKLGVRSRTELANRWRADVEPSS